MELRNYFLKWWPAAAPVSRKDGKEKTNEVPNRNIFNSCGSWHISSSGDLLQYWLRWKLENFWRASPEEAYSETLQDPQDLNQSLFCTEFSLSSLLKSYCKLHSLHHFWNIPPPPRTPTTVEYSECIISKRAGDLELQNTGRNSDIRNTHERHCSTGYLRSKM